MAKNVKQKTGPKPDILKVPGDWRDAMKKALDKKPPKKGWRKQNTKKEQKRQSG